MSFGEISGGVCRFPPSSLLRAEEAAFGSDWDVEVAKGLPPFLAARDCVPRMADEDGGAGETPNESTIDGRLPQFRSSFGIVSLPDSLSSPPSVAVAKVAV